MPVSVPVQHLNIIRLNLSLSRTSLVVLVVKNPPPGDLRGEFDPWVGKIPRRRARQPTPAFLPGESHGQRSLLGYSPRGCKELHMTEVTQHAHDICSYAFNVKLMFILYIICMWSQERTHGFIWTYVNPHIKPNSFIIKSF